MTSSLALFVPIGSEPFTAACDGAWNCERLVFTPKQGTPSTKTARKAKFRRVESASLDALVYREVTA